MANWTEYEYRWIERDKNRWKRYYLKYKSRFKLRGIFNRIMYRKRIDSKILNILGCSINEYKVYLENKFKPGMSWNNHKRLGWHIDHIVPCSKFNLDNEDEIYKCFHYTNTQPLWYYENEGKGNR